MRAPFWHQRLFRRRHSASAAFAFSGVSFSLDHFLTQASKVVPSIGAAMRLRHLLSERFSQYVKRTWPPEEAAMIRERKTKLNS
jgi:hypothetical protein